jgi:hypothetical protein
MSSAVSGSASIKTQPQAGTVATTTTSPIMHPPPEELLAPHPQRFLHATPMSSSAAEGSSIAFAAPPPSSSSSMMSGNHMDDYDNCLRRDTENLFGLVSDSAGQSRPLHPHIRVPLRHGGGSSSSVVVGGVIKAQQGNLPTTPVMGSFLSSAAAGGGGTHTPPAVVGPPRFLPLSIHGGGGSPSLGRGAFHALHVGSSAAGGSAKAQSQQSAPQQKQPPHAQHPPHASQPPPPQETSSQSMHHNNNTMTPGGTLHPSQHHCASYPSGASPPMGMPPLPPSPGAAAGAVSSASLLAAAAIAGGGAADDPDQDQVITQMAISVARHSGMREPTTTAECQELLEAFMREMQRPASGIPTATTLLAAAAGGTNPSPRQMGASSTTTNPDGRATIVSELQWAEQRDAPIYVCGENTALQQRPAQPLDFSVIGTPSSSNVMMLGGGGHDMRGHNQRSGGGGSSTTTPRTSSALSSSILRGSPATHAIQVGVSPRGMLPNTPSHRHSHQDPTTYSMRDDKGWSQPQPRRNAPRQAAGRESLPSSTATYAAVVQRAAPQGAASSPPRHPVAHGAVLAAAAGGNASIGNITVSTSSTGTAPGTMPSRGKRVQKSASSAFSECSATSTADVSSERSLMLRNKASGNHKQP